MCHTFFQDRTIVIYVRIVLKVEHILGKASKLTELTSRTRGQISLNFTSQPYVLEKLLNKSLKALNEFFN